VWKSLADYLRDPALELGSLPRQLKDIFVCTPLDTMRIRDIITVFYVNLPFTY